MSTTVLRQAPHRDDAPRAVVRPTRLHGTRGYTLVELMAVVAIVGILAALATYGVRGYLSAAKTAEAKEMVGAIAKAAVAAFARGNVSADAISFGGPDGSNGSSVHKLCESSDWVPDAATSVKGRKYQPSTAEDADFQKGDDGTGWKCLRFAVTSPMMYQLRYRHGDYDFTNGSTGLAGDFFVAQAQGDTDADDIPAWFQLGGTANADSVSLQTEVWVQNDTE